MENAKCKCDLCGRMVSGTKYLHAMNTLGDYLPVLEVCEDEDDCKANRTREQKLDAYSLDDDGPI